MKELSKDGEFWESSWITKWFLYALAVLILLASLDSMDTLLARGLQLSNRVDYGWVVISTAQWALSLITLWELTCGFFFVFIVAFLTSANSGALGYDDYTIASSWTAIQVVCLKGYYTQKWKIGHSKPVWLTFFCETQKQEDIMMKKIKNQTTLEAIDLHRDIS